MVATVGSIAIDLVTNAIKFAQGFKAASTTVERESTRMSKAVDGVSRASKAASGVVSGFVGGLVAGSVLAGLTSLTGAFGKARDAIAELDEIATNAKNVGLTTDSYQALAYSAKLANVDQEAFNKSLEIFAKNSGLAEHGTGALYAGLAKLNPELLRSIINAKDQRERLALVADVLHNTTDATEKAALATTIFGKAGIGLIPVLDGGAKSLDELEKRAKELGVTFEKELFDKNVDDQLVTISDIIDKQLKSALVNLSPAIVLVGNGLVTLTKGINNISRAITDFANNPSLAAFDKIRQSLITIDVKKGGFADSLVHAFTDAAGGADDLRQQIAAVEREIADTKQGIQELRDAGTDPIDMQGSVNNLKSLEAQLATLQAKLGEKTSFDINTAPAEAKLKALEKVADGVAGAIGSALAKAALAATGGGNLPIVHGSNLNTNDRPITNTVNGVGVTKFTSETNKEILKELKDQTQSEDQNAAETTSAIDDNTDATESTGSTIGKVLDDILAGQSTGFGNVAETVQAGSDELARAIQKGAYINFEALRDAVSTGIVSGFQDSFLGQQFTVNTGLQPEELTQLLDKFKQSGTPTIDQLNLLDNSALARKFINAGKFAEGGSFMVPGAGSGDRTLVSFLANGGEKVSVNRPGESGNTVNITYNAATGENEQTQRQAARRLGQMIQRELARA